MKDLEPFVGKSRVGTTRDGCERLEHFIAEEEQPVRQVILDARAISEIDITAAEEMKLLIERLREQGIDIVIAKAHLPLRQAMENLGLGQFYTQVNIIRNSPTRWRRSMPGMPGIRTRHLGVTGNYECGALLSARDPVIICWPVRTSA
jgi:hypothetical protein